MRDSAESRAFIIYVLYLYIFYVPLLADDDISASRKTARHEFRAAFQADADARCDEHGENYSTQDAMLIVACRGLIIRALEIPAILAGGATP